jgi:hypothetical protein
LAHVERAGEARPHVRPNPLLVFLLLCNPISENYMTLPHGWGPRQAPWIVLRSRRGPRIMPPITGPRRDGVRRGLPPVAKPRHGLLSRVL